MLTVTTLTLPSSPGWTLIILARTHLVGNVGSPINDTMSPTCRLRDGLFHLTNFCRWSRYSVDHRFQKLRVMAWHKCQRLNKVTDCDVLGCSGRASNGRPTKKCPGVKASMPSVPSGNGVSGLELRHASIWVTMVVNSSNVNLLSPITRQRCLLKDLTAASQSPPKCGAHSGVNFH